MNAQCLHMLHRVQIDLETTYTEECQLIQSQQVGRPVARMGMGGGGGGGTVPLTIQL